VALLGLIAGLFHPAGATLISHSISEKGRAYGLYGIGGSLGIAAAPILSGSVASIIGWKAPQVLFGLFALIIGGLSIG